MLNLNIFFLCEKGVVAELFSTHLCRWYVYTENLLLVLEYRSETVTEESRDERSKANSTSVIFSFF